MVRRAMQRFGAAVLGEFAAVMVMAAFGLLALANTATAATYNPAPLGMLDCNGFSPVQQVVKLTSACTDIRGLPDVDSEYASGGRFYDNGHYIGHDEPDMTFVSDRPGSGNDVNWTETLPVDPTALPTVGTPGGDVSHWFELSIAPWFSMALCNSQSYPQQPCVPNSDSNAPTCVTFLKCPPGSNVGAGSSALEVQFYPPGFGPFPDNISCDNTHWCASLHINDLECSTQSHSCNDNCIEPSNVAFIQRDGIPAGPPSPQEADLATFTPNGETLLMNPGDTVSVHIFDPPAPGGGHALEVTIDDLTTGQRGFMQASADNGFAQTSYADCSSKPFNYEPEYSTAAVDNYISWAGLRTNIGTAVELGHFTPCASVTDPFPFFLAPGVTDTVWGSCTGPYEDTAPGADGSGQVEPSDAPCYPAGDTHPVIPGNHDPDEVTGCADAFFQNGDLDYDGSPYWPEWPTGTSPTALYPSSFTQSPPTSHGHPFDQFFIQSNVAAGESTCPPPGTSASGCAIPPPTAPGAFYPYWSEAQHKGTCAIEFGNITGAPGVTDFGKATQYGTNQVAKLGYPIFQGALMSDDCPPR